MNKTDNKKRGFEDPNKNQEYLDGLRSRMEEFKDRTNEELIFELQKNESDTGNYGRQDGYRILNDWSKFYRSGQYQKHDHQRKEIKEKYNDDSFPLEYNYKFKKDKAEFETQGKLQHDVETFLMKEHNRSQDDLEKNRGYISFIEGLIIYGKPIGEGKRIPYVYHRNSDNRELDKEATFEGQVIAEDLKDEYDHPELETPEDLVITDDVMTTSYQIPKKLPDGSPISEGTWMTIQSRTTIPGIEGNISHLTMSEDGEWKEIPKGANHIDSAAAIVLEHMTNDQKIKNIINNFEFNGEEEEEEEEE